MVDFWRKQTRTSGFTLVELLVVIAIIVVIVSIATFNFFRATHRAKRAAAASFIAQLEIAISAYKIDVGSYPSDSEGSASLKAALDPEPEDPIWNNPRWRGPYLEFRAADVNSVSGHLLDPWCRNRTDSRRIYYYKVDSDADPSTVPPFHNRSSFDIYCQGFDGKTGTNDKGADEFLDGAYCQNGVDDDGDGVVDEIDPSEAGAADGFLEDDINNW